MIGNDRIEMAVEDDIHGFDLHRVAIAFENRVDAFGRVVFPAVYLSPIAGFFVTNSKSHVGRRFAVGGG